MTTPSVSEKEFKEALEGARGPLRKAMAAADAYFAVNGKSTVTYARRLAIRNGFHALEALLEEDS